MFITQILTVIIPIVPKTTKREGLFIKCYFHLLLKPWSDSTMLCFLVGGFICLLFKMLSKIIKFDENHKTIVTSGVIIIWFIMRWWFFQLLVFVLVVVDDVLWQSLVRIVDDKLIIEDTPTGVCVPWCKDRVESFLPNLLKCQGWLSTGTSVI